LLKNCFGSPFRASKRRGTSLFVGFSRAAMPYCAHSSTFEILFQQAVSRVIGNFGTGTHFAGNSANQCEL
jgi:hypothetical protein